MYRNLAKHTSTHAEVLLNAGILDSPPAFLLVSRRWHRDSRRAGHHRGNKNIETIVLQ